jgi:phosphoglycerol transferase
MMRREDLSLFTRANNSSLRAIFCSNASFFFIGAVACLILTGLFSIKYGVPLSLKGSEDSLRGGDHVLLLTNIKNLIEGGDLRFTHWLGFPSSRDNLTVPTFDTSYLLIVRLLTVFMHNVFEIADAFYIIGVLLIFAFAFLALRQLGVSAWVASAISVAYVVSPYLANRSFGHDYLALYYGVPLGAVLPLLMLSCFSWRDFWNLFTGWFGLLAIVISATSGIYYAFFTAMLVGVTGFGLSVSRRSTIPACAAIAVCATTFLLAVLTGFGVHVFEILRGGVPQLVRSPIEQLAYGLLISDAMHVFRDIGLWSSQFAIYHAARTPSEGELQWPGILFTTVILVAPALTLARTFQEAARTESQRTAIAGLAFLLITFSLLYAIRGGLGYVFNYIVAPQIRAQVRILPFLSFYAVVLVCFMMEALWSKGRAGRAAAVALAACAIASSLPYANSLAKNQHALFLNSPERQANAISLKAMLAAKDEVNIKAVLQLPYLDWPEAPSQLKFPAYAHELPFIFDQWHSPTRWSYGLSSMQPEFQSIEAKVEQANPLGLADRARNLQFDSILIEKQAYSPEENQRFAFELTQQVGGECLIYDDNFRMLFALTHGRGGKSCQAGL